MGWKRRFKNFVILRVKPFTRNPRVQLAMAFVLIVTGLCDVFEDVVGDLLGWKIGIAHGMVLFGVMNALYAVAQIVEGLDTIDPGAPD